MTSSVLPPCSSKVTVVTDPPSPPSSLVHARRVYGFTSTYVPKNAAGSGLWSNTNRYLPPTRASTSQDSRVIPIDLGTHHRLSSSALVNASNTMRAGPLMVRVTTTSRSDFRSTVVRFFTGPGLLSILAFIALLLSCQFLDNLVQLVEAFVPALAVPLEPHRLFLQSARAQLTCPHAPDLLRGDEARLLQNADVLLYARERHVERLGKDRDRSVGSSELLQNATPRGVRERGERSIKSGRHILNHMVQYNTSVRGMQGVAAKNDASYDLSSARISDRSDHHRCLYCDDVPERPHRDGPLCRRPVSQCVPAFRARADGGQAHPAHARRHTDGVEYAPPRL